MIREAFQWTLFKQAFVEWQNDKASRLGAALAYYTIFSLAPLLLIVIAIGGLVFGQEAAQGQILGELQTMLGKESAEAVQAMLATANKKEAGTWATLVGLAVLFMGATGVFAQLQDALDTVWQVKSPVQNGLWLLIKTRWISFAMVLGVGFLLLVSLVVSTLITVLGHVVTEYLPYAEFLMQLINIIISLTIITLLFAMIFKYLPNTRVAWSDVWVGAFVTAVLFTIGKFLIGLYLGNSAVGSVYGGAGALVIILLWTYYSAQILLYGAEYTEVFARTYGSHSRESKPKVRQI